MMELFKLSVLGLLILAKQLKPYKVCNEDLVILKESNVMYYLTIGSTFHTTALTRGGGQHCGNPGVCEVCISKMYHSEKSHVVWNSVTEVFSLVWLHSAPVGSKLKEQGGNFNNPPVSMNLIEEQKINTKENGEER